MTNITNTVWYGMHPPRRRQYQVLLEALLPREIIEDLRHDTHSRLSGELGLSRVVGLGAGERSTEVAPWRGQQGKGKCVFFGGGGVHSYVAYVGV